MPDFVGGTELSMVAFLVDQIVRALANDPLAVRVKELRGEASSIIEVYVAPEDFGRVIGRAGKHAEAIRTIINASSHGWQFKVLFLEPAKPA